jgi:hypothetical protein
MKKITIIISLILISVASAKYGNPRLHNEYSEKFFKRFYKAHTKKEATLSNVFESIQLTNKKNEVSLALMVLACTNEVTNKNEVAKLVLQVYNNSTEPKVRTRAAHSLLSFNKEKGIELCKQVINDENYRLSERLILSKVLIDYDVLEGYDLDSPSARSEAESLIIKYKEHDGEKDVKGNKIDILEILNSSTNAFNHPELMKNMSNDVVRARAQKSQ